VPEYLTLKDSGTDGCELTVNRQRLEAKTFLGIKVEQFQSNLPKRYREKEKK